MEIQCRIEEKLNQAFELEYLAVENESHMHNVAPGSETHFRVVIVTKAFSGLMPVKRHRMVFTVLSEELDKHVHALALHTYVPSEWDEVKNRDFSSPHCLGGFGK